MSAALTYWLKLELFGAGAGGTTGVVNATSPLPSLAASGTPVVTGSAGVTSPTATLAAAGTPVVVGAVTATSPLPTLAASGAPVVSGQVAAASPLPTLSASGSPVVSGQVVVTTPVPTLQMLEPLVIRYAAPGELVTVDVTSSQGVSVGAAPVVATASSSATVEVASPAVGATPS